LIWFIGLLLIRIDPTSLVLGVLSSTRNVWSAAVLQAKNGSGFVGLRECIRPLLE
jgi:hypothetical protein